MKNAFPLTPAKEQLANDEDVASSGFRPEVKTIAFMVIALLILTAIAI